MRSITTDNLGQAWIKVMNTILKDGTDCMYTDNAGDQFNVREIIGLNVVITNPQWPDEIITSNMVESEFQWMKDNFTVKGPVAALHNEDSYATRLYNYMGIKDQLNWVVERLKAEPRLRSATITMLEPLKDDKYIPCVSLLDFNVENEKLCLYSYCRALDFGTKAYANLAMLYDILESTANRLQLKPGKLELLIKSAHIYDHNMVRAQSIVNANI